MRVVRPCVRADPFFRRAVAVFARDAFLDFEVSGFAVIGNRLDRCVTDCAAVALRRVANFQNVGDAFRARRCKRGDGPLMMEIVLRPDGELSADFSRAAVTTACVATL